MNEYIILNENKILFDRYDDINVKGYNIHVEETLPDGSVASYLLATLPNPEVARPLLVRKAFKHNDKGEYVLPNKRVYFNEVYRINVYINGRRLNTIFITYNEKNKTVYLDYTKINDWDTIEIEYYHDGVEYTHATTNNCKYSVELIVDYDKSTVGTHNILL